MERALHDTRGLTKVEYVLGFALLAAVAMLGWRTLGESVANKGRGAERTLAGLPAAGHLGHAGAGSRSSTSSAAGSSGSSGAVDGASAALGAREDRAQEHRAREDRHAREDRAREDRSDLVGPWPGVPRDEARQQHGGWGDRFSGALREGFVGSAAAVGDAIGQTWDYTTTPSRWGETASTAGDVLANDWRRITSDPLGYLADGVRADIRIAKNIWMGVGEGVYDAGADLVSGDAERMGRRAGSLGFEGAAAAATFGTGIVVRHGGRAVATGVRRMRTPRRQLSPADTENTVLGRTAVAEGRTAEVTPATARRKRARERRGKDGHTAGGGYFTPDEWRALHPRPDYPIYHDVGHSEAVARMTRDLARARGLPEDDVDFWEQVAVLHDVDPARKPGAPARVPVTLERLEQDFDGTRPLVEGYEGSVLRDRFGWDEVDLAKAQAGIQRTEFPFNTNRTGQGDGLARQNNPAYAEVSPAERYERRLEGLPPEAREDVRSFAPLLSEYGDKGSSHFTEPFAQARARVSGLANETGVPEEALQKGTAGFVDGIGRPGSFQHDVEIAARQGGEFRPVLRDQILDELPPHRRRQFESNLEHFRDQQRAMEEGRDFPTDMVQRARVERGPWRPPLTHAGGLDQDTRSRVTHVELRDGHERLGGVRVDLHEHGNRARLELTVRVEEPYRQRGASRRLYAEVERILDGDNPVTEGGRVTQGRSVFRETNLEQFDEHVTRARELGLSEDEAMARAAEQTPTGRRWKEWGFRPCRAPRRSQHRETGAARVQVDWCR